MGSRSRRQPTVKKPKQKLGKRKTARKGQSVAVARCFNALNAVHQASPAPDPEVARSLKLLRNRLIELERDHNKAAGLWPQVERWSARASAAFAFFLIHPLMAWWDAAGYPYPGPAFWSNESVIASASTAAGWFLAIMIVARAVVGAVLGWLFLAIVACLLVALFFKV